MTPHSSPAFQAQTTIPDRPPPDSPAFSALRISIGDALSGRASDIASRWHRQARSVALLEDGPPNTDDEDHSVRSLVEAIAEALRVDVSQAETSVVLGLAVGTAAFERRASLHHTLKGLDLLTAMILYAIESDLSDLGESSSSTADGIRIARRVQQMASLLSIATAKGYTQAVGGEIRDQFRSLRHDLRNPLGTIKNVLAMMNDETLTAEVRANPKFLAMAERNARSLEEMIAFRLGDVAALLPNTADQEVALYTIACSVRRDLRADIEAQGLNVVVNPSPAPVRINASSLELILLAVLQSAVQEGVGGEVITVSFGDVTKGYASVMLECEPARPPINDSIALERITVLAQRLSTRVEAGKQVTISVLTQEIAPEPA